jgi:nitroreductase
MELHEALYTTRAMRRVTTDPIDDDTIARIVDAGIRAPSGGNQQKWRFLFVRDAATKATLQGWYRDGLDQLNATVYADLQRQIVEGDPNDPAVIAARRTDASAQWLADNLHHVPVLLFAFGKPAGESSIYPALWSMQLAARAEGIGTSLTTLLFKYYRAEVLELLGAPDDGEWVLYAMVTFGIPTGRWGVAARQPAHEVTYLDRWGATPSWTVDTPRWTS